MWQTVTRAVLHAENELVLLLEDAFIADSWLTIALRVRPIISVLCTTVRVALLPLVHPCECVTNGTDRDLSTALLIRDHANFPLKVIT